MIAKTKIKEYLITALPIVLIAGFSVFFFFYSTPENIIAWLGVSNAYLLIFIIAFLGGLTTFSGVPYPLVVMSMSVGGLNPFILGLASTSGVILGDSTSYYIGYRGRMIVPGNFQKFFQRIYDFSLTHPKVLPLFCFLYGSFVPLSNDFITISAGLAHYPFWRIMLPLAGGNLVFNISLALLAPYAYTFLEGIFF